MRLCVMASEFPVRSQTFVMHHVTGMLDRRMDVQVIGHQGEEAAWQSLGDYAATLRDRVWHPEIPIPYLARLQGIMNLRQEGHVDRSGYWQSFNVFRFGQKALNLNLPYLYALASKIAPIDVLHCHFGPNGILGAYLKQLGLVNKLVVTFHGYDLSMVANGPKHPYQVVFDEADAILPVSERWHRRLLQLGAPAERTSVHHMGIDVQAFPYRERNASQEAPLRLITTARFMEKKGLEYAVEAVAEVAKQRPDLNFTYELIGDGPLCDEIGDQVRALGMESRINLHGALAHDEVQGLLKEADIFLLPSVTASNGDQEGIPVALMEAMASGMPVLSTFHSGIPELVEDGVSGYLVPERDSHSLAAKLLDLLEHPETRIAFGREGRKKVESEFHLDNLNDGLVSLYNQMLSDQSVSLGKQRYSA